MSKNKKIHYAFWILLAVSVIRGFAGPSLNGSSGLFLTPVSKDLGVGIGRLSLYLSVSSVVSLVWLPVAGNLFNRFSARTLAVAGVLLQGLSFTAMGFLNHVWGWYLLAVPMAMGAVLLVNLLGPVLINRWFRSHQGLMMGLMMSVTSLFGALFQPLLTHTIAGRGWRFAYIAFGLLATACILLVAVTLLRNKPEDAHVQPFQSQKADARQPRNKSANGTSIRFVQAVRSHSFYLLVLFVVVITGFASFSQHISTFATNEGFSTANIGTALSLAMVGSAIGSMLIGYCSDQFGIVTTSLGVIVMGGVSVALFLFGGSMYALFSAATFLHGLASSSIGLLAPLLTSAFYGYQDYEKLYSFVMMGAPFSSIVLLPLYGFIYDAFQSYRLVLLFLLGALTAGALCLWGGRVSSRRLAAKTDNNQ